MKGNLIVIEGTDCSGKETQTKLLVEKLESEGRKVVRFSFPMYDSPTGKIVGGPYLGKDYICNGWFEEGATNVDYKVASLYYAADRVYNISKITEKLDLGYDVILDRYVYSNMAHQGAKIDSKEERINLYEWLEQLEFDLLKLPIPNIKIFLHMPTEYSVYLRKGRNETADQHEADINHLKSAEQAYKEIKEKYDFITIECVKDNSIRTIEDINREIVDILKNNYLM